MSPRPRFIAGIDPGLNGAVALFCPDPLELVIADMPTNTVTVNKKERQRIDPYALARFFDLYDGTIIRAVVEEVGPHRQDSNTGAFTFGVTAGYAMQAVASAGLPMVLIPPAVWKRMMGVKADKSSSRIMATRLIPQYGAQFSRVKDDGRAEATLLAMMGWKL